MTCDCQAVRTAVSYTHLDVYKRQDEKYYPNPELFDPERFAEGNKIPKGAYLPFGDGPRICIG